MQVFSRLDTTVFYFIAIINLAVSATQISFELPASYAHSAQKKCLSYWLSKGSHVTAHFKAPVAQGQVAHFEIYDQSPNANQYGTKADFNDQTLVFSPQENTDVYFCFWNVLNDGLTPGPSYVRQIGLQIQVGKTDEDYQKLAKAEKLKPHELTLKQLEERFKSISAIMTVVKNRDSSKLATHENIKNRIANFSFFSIIVLLVVGVWQIAYLRNFFKSKRLI